MAATDVVMHSKTRLAALEVVRARVAALERDCQRLAYVNLTLANEVATLRGLDYAVSSVKVDGTDPVIAVIDGFRTVTADLASTGAAEVAVALDALDREAAAVRMS